MQTPVVGIRHGLLLVAAAWLAPIGATLFAPVLPHMIAYFAEVPHADILAPLALVTPALFVALLAPVAGILTDRIGRKRVLVGALAIYAVAGIAPFWINNLYGIILSRCVVGIAEAGVMTASTALICDYFDGQRRAHWLSVQFGSAAVVSTVCFVLAGFLGGYGWRAPFLAYGATALFIPLVLLIIFEPSATGMYSVSRVSASGKLFTPRFIACLGLTLLFGVLFYITPVHISLVFNARGFTDPQTLGLASAVGSVGLVTGATLFRLLSQRAIGALLGLAMFAQAIGFAVLYTQPALSSGIVGMFVNNVGCGISLPLVLAFTMSRLGNDNRGRASGVWTSAFFVGQFACPLVVGAVASASGGILMAMAIFAIFTLIAAVTFLVSSAFGRSLREPVTDAGQPIIITH